MRTLLPVAIDGAGYGARNDDLNWSLLDAKADRAAGSIRDREPPLGHRVGPVQRPADRGDHRACRLRQDDAVGRVGRGRGSPRRVGEPRSVRRRRGGAALRHGVRLRRPLAGGRRPARRHAWRRRLGPRPSRPPPRVGVPRQSRAVRLHGGRSPRAAGPGLPRRAGHGHGRDARPVPVRRRQPSRTAAPAPGADLG